MHRTISNYGHASLCQTGIRSELLTRLEGLCRRPSPFIDLALWHATGILEATNYVVSIKGMPGRPGIGVGHRPGPGGWTADPKLEQLQAWTGSAIAHLYMRFSRGRSFR